MDETYLLWIFLFSILIYFLPSFVASGRENQWTIGALNLFFGWSVVGWWVALVWALSSKRLPKVPDEA